MAYFPEPPPPVATEPAPVVLSGHFVVGIANAAAYLGIKHMRMKHLLFHRRILAPDYRIEQLSIFRVQTLEAIRAFVGPPRRRPRKDKGTTKGPRR